MSVKKWGLSGFAVTLLFLFASWIYFSPGARQPLRKFFAWPERRVLSVATGKIFPDSEGRVVKLQTPAGILLEIYSLAKPEEQPLIDRIQLPDKRDAQFQFRARATNLALKDLDGDDVFEIIAPSYDATLVPHLNIYRFSKDSARFEPYAE